MNRILVVDDDAACCEAAAGILLEAFKCLRHAVPDAVVPKPVDTGGMVSALQPLLSEHAQKVRAG